MNDKQKPVIFLAFANDQDDRVGYLRNLPEEARQIRDPLQRARADGLCDLVELANASADDIFRVFQSPEYRDRIAIFHYAGHANGYELLLESSEQKTTAANAEAFANFLGQQLGLQLVFLNGCSTQEQAQGLLDANVASVIATSRAIDDRVAMQFSSRFYQGLAGGAGIQRAFKEAEAAVTTQTGGQTRGAYFGDSKTEVNVDRWPWDLYVRDGSEPVRDWSLPSAAGDPLFGLPDLPITDLPGSPFRHLHWFEAEDAVIFFGRGHQIRELYDLVTSDDTAPVIMLYGRSGVGKSSVLAAGLIPRLIETHEVVYVRRNQSIGLAWTMKDAIGASKFSGSGSNSVHCLEDWTSVEKKRGLPLLVVVDQVEECFSRPNPDLPSELDDFLSEVHNIFGDREHRPRGKLILGFRKEWLADIERQVQEYRIPKSKVFLERLGRHGIVEAIQGPCSSPRLQKQYQLTCEENLAEMIADDLIGDNESAIAPTLQILLTKMWDKATEIHESRPVFDQALYRSLKNNGILLQDFLDQQLEELSRWQRDVTESGLALDLLAHHTTELGTANTRSAEELPGIYGHRKDVLNDLVQRCKDLYLLVDLTSDGRSELSGTRLSHDTLAPLVRARFESSDRPGQRARRVLDNRMSDWSTEKQGAPLSERDLQIVEQGLNGSRSLTDLEMKLLEFSRKERANQLRLRNFIKLSGGIAIVVIFALIAFSVKSTIDRQSAETTAAKTRENSALKLAAEKEKWFKDSLGVVDEFYSTIAQDDLINQPGMTTLRTNLLDKGVGFLEDFTNQFGRSNQLSREISAAQYHLGRIYLDRGINLEQAIASLENAEELQSVLLEQSPDDTDLVSAYSKTLMEIGNYYVEINDLRKAFANYEKARTKRAVLVFANPASDVFMLDLADSEMNIGNVQRLEGQLEEASATYQTAHNKRLQALKLLERSESDELTQVALTRTHRRIAKGQHNMMGLFEKMAGMEREKAANESDEEQMKSILVEARKFDHQFMEYSNKAISQFRNFVLPDQPNDGEAKSLLAECHLRLATRIMTIVSERDYDERPVKDYFHIEDGAVISGEEANRLFEESISLYANVAENTQAWNPTVLGWQNAFMILPDTCTRLTRTVSRRHWIRQSRCWPSYLTTRKRLIC